MWMGKLTRTGLLFPEESRAVNLGVRGEEGGWRGSSAEVENAGAALCSTTVNEGAAIDGRQEPKRYVNRSVLAERGRVNPALMVLTHPEIEAWHRECIREATVEYGIGVVFVPLFRTNVEQYGRAKREEEGLAVLKPLGPGMVGRFASFDALKGDAGGTGDVKEAGYGRGKVGSLEEEMVLEVDVSGNVEEIIGEVVRGVQDVMFSRFD